MRLQNQVFDHPARFEITLSLKLAQVNTNRSLKQKAPHLKNHKKVQGCLFNSGTLNYLASK